MIEAMTEIVREDMQQKMPETDVKIVDCVMVGVGDCWVPITMTFEDKTSADPDALLRTKCTQTAITIRDAYTAEGMNLPEKEGLADAIEDEL